MPTEEKGWIFWKEDSPHANLAVNDAMLGGTTKLETLVRELIQNGADARQNGTTAKLVAEDGELLIEEIKDYLCLQDLNDHIQGTMNFANERNEGGRIVPKCQSQLELLRASKMRYFKFSDYGTKGIRGIDKYDKDLAFWKLIFEEGTSDKGPESAGGVGVGKNATFPFSQISTVLYSTLTSEGYGLAGSAHLATSKIDGQKYRQKGNLIKYGSYQGVLSDLEHANVKPLGLNDLAGIKTNLFARDELGSDVIILATNGNQALQNEEWPYQFAAFAVKNFYIAFKKKHIELTIKHSGTDDIVIGADNCTEVLDRITDLGDISVELLDAVRDAKLVIATFDGLVDNPLYKTIHHEEPKLGPVTLFLNSNIDTGEKGWCLFRSFGMRTVTRQVRPQKPVFGVLVVESKQGSELLLKAESGNHTEYDYQAMGENSGEEAEKAISALEKWVKNQILSFGRVDTSNTDIDLAGFSNFVSLQDGIKTGDSSGGTRPILEVEHIKSKKKSKNKPKVRKRESDAPDPEVVGESGTKKEQWDHSDERHKKWDRQRITEDVPGGKNPPEKRSIEKEISVSATFRDVHDPFSDTVEIVGKLFGESLKGKYIDLRIMAVDEQGKVNSLIPRIASVKDLKTGASISDIEKGNTVKNVPVGNDGYVHLEVVYETPFRGRLVETAFLPSKVTMPTLTEKDNK